MREVPSVELGGCIFSVLCVGQAPGKSSCCTPFPPPPSAIRVKPQQQHSEGFTPVFYSLAESPWLQHLMCSCYVIDCNECFIYVLCLSCSYRLRVKHNKTAGLPSWTLSDQCKQCCRKVIAVLLAFQRDAIFTNMKCY